jgi:hypothetical protein
MDMNMNNSSIEERGLLLMEMLGSNYWNTLASEEDSDWEKTKPSLEGEEVSEP